MGVARAIAWGRQAKGHETIVPLYRRAPVLMIGAESAARIYAEKM